MNQQVIIEHREELGQCGCVDAHIFYMVNNILLQKLIGCLPILNIIKEFLHYRLLLDAKTYHRLDIIWR